MKPHTVFLRDIGCHLALPRLGRTTLRLACVVLAAWCLPTCTALGSELVEAEVASDLVPSPVEYAVLLPDGYRAGGEPYPLVLDLHGGGGDRSNLARFKPVYDELWRLGELPPLVVVTPSVTERSFYMNYRDGSEQWESFVTGPFLDHVRSTYNIRGDRQGTLVTGVSMGGMGSLRMAFKHPEKFLAVAALEPGIEPILSFDEMRPKHRFWRSSALLEAAFGAPVDADYWAQNNPASIATADPARLRDSGLAIYVECGDDDQFWLYEGAEFLHRTLYDQRVKHEYHLVRGADHVGTSINARKRESLRFLARALSTPVESARSSELTRRLDPLKARLSERDHYSLPRD